MKNLSVRSGALDGALFKGMMLAAADYLENYKEEINGLNVFPVPDGDTGDNMCSTVRSGAKALIPITDGEICAVLNALKSGMLLGARGNSGVILSQLFAGFADGLSGMREARISDIRSAMKKGVQRAYDAVSTPTEGTILTVAREGVLYADGKAKYICYALAAENKENPPNEIKNVCTFVPSSVFKEKEGFFIIFQSAATGECIKPERA